MESRHEDLDAPLLSYKQDDGQGKKSEARSEVVGKLIEGKTQLGLGTPVFLVGALDFGTTFVSVAFVGRLGTMYLAGAAMAASFGNVTGFAILEGLASGMETSGGQAYGSGQSHVLGYLIQRGQFVLVMVASAITLIWVNASRILCLVGQDPEIATLAGRYLLHLLPGLFMTALFLPLTKFLTVQGVTKPLAGISCVVILGHALFCWFYIHWLDFGYVGAALATSTSGLVMLTLLVIFLNLERSGILSRTWSGWSLAAFDNLGAFMALAVPACAMLAFEWWAWELVQLMSGWLPRPAVAVSVMNISFFTLGICFTLSLGMAAAACIRVSNALGAQSSERAKQATKVAMILAVVTGVMLSLLVLFCGKYWAQLFVGSSSSEVLDGIIDVIPIVASSIFLLNLGMCLSGVLRGSGQQLAGSIVNGVTLYGVALPLAYVLGNKMEWAEKGLWTGMTIALVLQLAGLLFLVLRTDWDYQVRRAVLTLNSNFESKTEALVY